MSGAIHAIKLVKVIGQDAKVYERSTEILQRFQGVIDAAKQDGLIEHGNSVVDQTSNRLSHIQVDLLSMIDMQYDPWREP